MTTKTLKTTTMAAMLVLAIAAVAYAGPGWGRGGCGGQGYGGGNGVYSQLTPEKQAQVDKIYEKYSPRFQEMRDQMWAKHATLQAMVNSGNADEAKIGKLTSEITNLRNDMHDLRVKMGDELEKTTGIAAFNGRGNCPGFGQGRGHGGYHGGNHNGWHQRGDCPGYAQGGGRY